MSDFLKNINAVDVCVVIFTGTGLIISIITSQKEIAMALGGGLLGYLGGAKLKNDSK